MPAEIIEYILVTDEGAWAINEEVNKWIKEGYQPLGPTQICPYKDDVIVAQTMVKYRDPHATNEPETLSRGEGDRQVRQGV